MAKEKCSNCEKELGIRKYGPKKDLCQKCVRFKIAAGEVEPKTRKSKIKKAAAKISAIRSKQKKREGGAAPTQGDAPILNSQEMPKEAAIANAMKKIYELKQTSGSLPKDVRAFYLPRLEMAWIWIATAFPELLVSVMEKICDERKG